MYNNVDLISETYEDTAKENLQSSISTTPLQFDDSSPRKAFKYINNLYHPKLEPLTYIFAADSMGLCLLLFTQISLKVETAKSKNAGKKTDFDMK